MNLHFSNWGSLTLERDIEVELDGESQESLFGPPQFHSHRLIRGGHLQTIAKIKGFGGAVLQPKVHSVPVSDDDRVLLHEDCPVDWAKGDASMLLLHGISGCHAAPYMLRLAAKLKQKGVRVFRIDMRGCGAARKAASSLTHAGRSDDVIAALDWIAAQTVGGPMLATGVSLGGQQLLRAVGRVGAGLDSEPSWFERLRRIVAVAPPIDLQRCSDNMQRLVLRPYNYYFIRALMSRVPPQVAIREDFQRQAKRGRPKTLFELDDRFTGPLSGFAGATDYYSKSSAKDVVVHNPIPTLVLASADDPIVPVGCFRDDPSLWPSTTHLHVEYSGGHVGFIEKGRTSWMDRCVLAWFDLA